jgi:hypothetical protein
MLEGTGSVLNESVVSTCTETANRLLVATEDAPAGTAWWTTEYTIAEATGRLQGGGK